MLRGAACGTLAGLLGAAVKTPGLLFLFCCPWTLIQAWTLLLLAAALLVGASLPFALIQEIARHWLPSRALAVVTIVLGIPFGFAVCWSLSGFLGLQGSAWNEDSLVAWIPSAFGAGLGLGCGRLRGSTGHQ
jgi:hypothetical protein